MKFMRMKEVFQRTSTVTFHLLLLPSEVVTRNFVDHSLVTLGVVSREALIPYRNGNMRFCQVGDERNTEV